MLKEMNPEIFRNNLLMAIDEIKEKQCITTDNYYFMIFKFVTIICYP